MGAGNHDLEIEQEVDRTITFTIATKSGDVITPTNITGYVFEFKIADSFSGTAPFTVTPVITDAPNGKVQVTISKSNASLLLKNKNYVYELAATKPDTKRIRYVQGNAWSSPKV